MEVRYNHQSRASLKAAEKRAARRQMKRTAGAFVGVLSLAAAGAVAALRSGRVVHDEPEGAAAAGEDVADAVAHRGGGVSAD